MTHAPMHLALEQPTVSLPAEFGFRLADAAVSVQAEPDPRGCRFMLEIDLGPIPFSAESPERRRLRLALIELNAGPACRFRECKGRLVLTAESHVDGAPTPQRLVAAALALALSLRPEMAIAGAAPDPVSPRSSAAHPRALAA